MTSTDRGAAPARALGGLGRRAAALGALACALAACGRKGDLVPPPAPAAAAGEGQGGGRPQGAGG